MLKKLFGQGPLLKINSDNNTYNINNNNSNNNSNINNDNINNNNRTTAPTAPLVSATDNSWMAVNKASLELYKRDEKMVYNREKFSNSFIKV